MPRQQKHDMRNSGDITEENSKLPEADLIDVPGTIRQPSDAAPAVRRDHRALLYDAARLLAEPELRLAVTAYSVVALSLLGAAIWFTPPLTIAVFVIIGWLLFAPAEYLLHRYVLHPLIYLNSRIFARFWIRVHYAHHHHPSRTDVILASPVSVLLLIAVLNIPVAVIVGPDALFASTFAIIVPFLFYELVHFSAHAPIEYVSTYFLNRQRLHILHHFHNEKRNFGICWSVVDRLAGTYAHEFRDAERSVTARNLGYDEALARQKPS